MADNEIKEKPVETKPPVEKKDLPKPADLEKKYKNAMVAVVVLAAIIVIGGVALLGIATRRMVTSQRGINTFQVGGVNSQNGGPRGFGSGAGMHRGLNQATTKVTAVNGKQFTIDQSGTSYTVQITDNTRFPLNSATTVKVGDQVVVVGEKDSNGVIQADRIVVNPSTSTVY